MGSLRALRPCRRNGRALHALLRRRTVGKSARARLSGIRSASRAVVDAIVGIVHVA
jgi:hypothetical protein